MEYLIVMRKWRKWNVVCKRIKVLKVFVIKFMFVSSKI